MPKKHKAPKCRHRVFKGNRAIRCNNKTKRNGYCMKHYLEINRQNHGGV